MICGHGDANFVIPEGKCKLTCPQKLLILPSIIIIVYAHAREELRDGINIISIFRKIFKATALSENVAVNDVKSPFDCEGKFLATFQRLWQIKPHHGIVDGKLNWF